MSSESPWSIKGVSRADRDIAKQEARKSGEPIGVWLARRIRDAAAPGQGPETPLTQTALAGETIPPEGDRRQPGRAAGQRATDHPDFAFGAGNWRQARETILAREEARFSEGLAALRDRVRSVETRLEARNDANAGVAERIQGLSDRIADLAARLEALESKPGDDRLDRKVGLLEDDIAELDRFARRLPAETTDALDGLGRRVEQLVDRMRVVEEFVLPGNRKPGVLGRLFGRKRR